MKNLERSALKTTKSNSDEGVSLKGELIGHLVLYLALSMIFQVAFYRESVAVVQRFLGGLYWLFVLPGATLLLAWGKRWGFVERAVAGSVLALAIVGTVSYYLGLLGLHVKYHGFLLTPVLIAIGIVACWRRR